MPNLIIQERNNKRVTPRKASRAYSDEFLIDTSPSDQPYPGAWEPYRWQQQYISAGWPAYSFCNTPAVNPESFEVCKSDWSVIKNPFTQEDRLDTEEEQLQELIFRFATTLSAQSRARIVNRLIALLNIAKEEDSLQIGIKIGSLRNFYNFLQLNADLKCPAISLTPDSNIYASWRGENNRVFSVHFLPTNEDARFVILKPNERHPGRQVQVSGSATIDIIMKIVEQFKVLSWAKE